MQRHHLLPIQLLTPPSLSRFFAKIEIANPVIDDFRQNGLLLPCTEKGSIRWSLPLHRGPHPRYSEVVQERVGQIEARWAINRFRSGEGALSEARMRIKLLQAALRKRLLKRAPNPFYLNCKDPLKKIRDFSELDAMAEKLWSQTSTAHIPLA